jgi:NDP-sugar pyrophosphorylase family protein
MDHFGNGQSHGVRIRYSDDGDRLLGTAGSLKKASGLLSERFFITFGDAYPILDFRTAWKHFLLTHKLALMMVYRNCNRYGRSNAVIRDGMVSFYSKKEDAPGMEYIEFGVTFMSKKVLEMIPDDRPVDLEVLYRQLISKKQMAALEVKQRTYDIGSPQGLAEFRELVNSGQIQF